MIQLEHLLRILSRDSISYYRFTCSSVIIALLFTTAKKWKQPRCPSTNESIITIWHIDPIEYYLLKTHSSEAQVPLRMCEVWGLGFGERGWHTESEGESGWLPRSLLKKAIPLHTQQVSHRLGWKQIQWFRDRKWPLASLYYFSCDNIDKISKYLNVYCSQRFSNYQEPSYINGRSTVPPARDKEKGYF